MTYDVRVVLELPYRPQRQTIQGSPKNAESLEPTGVGNCYPACIASLLGVDLAEVPHIQHLRNLAEDEAGRELPYHDRRIAREWLRSTHELDLGSLARAELDGLEVPYIVTVRSHRGDWNHAVIARAGAVIFDPSGLDDYTTADYHPDDPAGETIVLPYEPGPAELVALWLAEVDT